MIPVQLLSEPIDAEVYMNNKFMGRTPTLTTVPEGKYSFIFRKENYIEVFKEKDIRNQTTVNAKMKMTGEYKKLLAAQSGKSPFPWIKFVGGVVLAGGAAAPLSFWAQLMLTQARQAQTVTVGMILI